MLRFEIRHIFSDDGLVDEFRYVLELFLCSASSASKTASSAASIAARASAGRRSAVICSLTRCGPASVIVQAVDVRANDVIRRRLCAAGGLFVVHSV